MEAVMSFLSHMVEQFTIFWMFVFMLGFIPAMTAGAMADEKRPFTGMVKGLVMMFVWPISLVYLISEENKEEPKAYDEDGAPERDWYG